VETVVSISQLRSLLPTEEKSEDKTGLTKAIPGLMSAVVSMGGERLLLQLCGGYRMFAVDPKSSRVEQIVQPLGTAYWTGWVWRDGSTADGLIVCKNDGTFAFNTHSRSIQRVCDRPHIAWGHICVMGDGTIVEMDWFLCVCDRPDYRTADADLSREWRFGRRRFHPRTGYARRSHFYLK
jgi:hypothetical protein